RLCRRRARPGDPQPARRDVRDGRGGGRIRPGLGLVDAEVRAPPGRRGGGRAGCYAPGLERCLRQGEHILQEEAQVWAFAVGDIGCEGLKEVRPVDDLLVALAELLLVQMLQELRRRLVEIHRFWTSTSSRQRGS